jgi:hypothetical protein
MLFVLAHYSPPINLRVGCSSHVHHILLTLIWSQVFTVDRKNLCRSSVGRYFGDWLDFAIYYRHRQILNDKINCGGSLWQ